MPEATTKPLSFGAMECERRIRAARVRKGGQRECGRSYLANRLGVTVRQVSRYLKELRDAGRIEVTPPRRVKRRDGWRTDGVNRFRLLCDHATLTRQTHNRRSRRGDTYVRPLPNGSRAGRAADPHRPISIYNQPDEDRPDTSAVRARVRAALREGRKAAATRRSA